MTTAISNRQFEIIEAAGKILTTSGISGLTIKNLAKEMQFSESAIYRHFSCKEEIIIAMLNYLAESMDSRYSEIISKTQSPEEKFTILFQNQLAFFDKNPHFVVAVFSDGLLEESQRINETILKIMQIKKKHLAPIIAEGQQQAVFINTIPADEIIHIIMGAFRLQMFKWRTAHFQFDIMDKGQNLIKTLLSIIKIK